MSATEDFLPKICVHCKKSKVNRPKNLCWNCYYTPGVKDLYPSNSKFSRRGIGNGCHPVKRPRKPTTAPPGSLRKMRVMLNRIKRLETVDHPRDAKDWGHATEEDKADQLRRGRYSGSTRSTSDEVALQYFELDSAESE